MINEKLSKFEAAQSLIKKIEEDEANKKCEITKLITNSNTTHRFIHSLNHD